VRFLGRFSRLERPRRSPAEPGRSATGERFQVLEASAAIPEVHSAGLDRFAPPLEPALELVAPTAAQPFVRCPRCSVDARPGTTRCQCGNALDTAEVAAFNADLWSRHREEEAAGEERVRLGRARELESARRLHEARQALGEEIARDVAARERGIPGQPVGLAAAILVGLLVLLAARPLGLRLLALVAIALGVRAGIGWLRERGGPRSDREQ